MIYHELAASVATPLLTARHSPYVLPTVCCQSLSVPSSDPDAYSSPSGEYLTQWTGPKWPLYDSKNKIIYN